jgi:hypothetical protein
LQLENLVNCARRFLHCRVTLGDAMKAFAYGLCRMGETTWTGAEISLVSAVSLISVVIGVAFACAAERVPAHRVALERAGGVLLLAGLAVFGGALRHFC